MPVLILNLEESMEIPFSLGQSVREILDATDFRVRTGCSGSGACGLCLVRIEQGRAGEPTPVERIHLDDVVLDRGIRLACQLMPKEDLRISIVNTAPKSSWKTPASRLTRHFPPLLSKDLPEDVHHPKGIAVDLGTTFINLSMWDMASGRHLTGRYGLNPQTAWGADVITRLAVASESREKALLLRRQVIEALGEALKDIAVREGIHLHEVIRVALVGNTAMLALLSGCNHELLLRPEYWAAPIDCRPDSPTAWRADLSIHPKAMIEIIPPLAGFVGSDLLAGVLATALTEKGPGGLLIDFGTNSEIALWDGKTLWVTSAAGGPAFEGSGIGCGMPAEKGAIYRMSVNAAATLEFDVVGGCEPLGLCGSGMVDLLAILVRSHRVDPTGKFVHPAPLGGFVIRECNPEIVLTKRDVDVFQRAKAAIAAGIKILMAWAGMNPKDLRVIHIGGAFGQCLDVANAREIGLLPDIETDLLRLCGNTALTGCEEVLLSAASRDCMERLRVCTRVINLSDCQDFGDHYMDNLYLRSMYMD